jgi:hypothetical protein
MRRVPSHGARFAGVAFPTRNRVRSRLGTNEFRLLGFEGGAQPLHRAPDAIGQLDGGSPTEFLCGSSGIQCDGMQLIAGVLAEAGRHGPIQDGGHQTADLGEAGVLPGADVVCADCLDRSAAGADEGVDDVIDNY